LAIGICVGRYSERESRFNLLSRHEAVSAHREGQTRSVRTVTTLTRGVPGTEIDYLKPIRFLVISNDRELAPDEPIAIFDPPPPATQLALAKILLSRRRGELPRVPLNFRVVVSADVCSDPIDAEGGASEPRRDRSA
jgi:hypothetical protein